MKSRLLGLTILTLGLALCSGCTGRVVRTITVESEPQGAVVWLNDNEIGRTPVTAEFTWYGVYRVRLESPGYETYTTFEAVKAPWFQWLGVDLFAETVAPGVKRDVHHFGPYTLAPVKAEDPEAVLDRAKEFRKEAEQPKP